MRGARSSRTFTVLIVWVQVDFDSIMYTLFMSLDLHAVYTQRRTHSLWDLARVCNPVGEEIERTVRGCTDCICACKLLCIVNFLRFSVDSKCSTCPTCSPICWYKSAWLVHWAVDLYALTISHGFWPHFNLRSHWLFFDSARRSLQRWSQGRWLREYGGRVVLLWDFCGSDQEVFWPAWGVGLLSSVICNEHWEGGSNLPSRWIGDTRRWSRCICPRLAQYWMTVDVYHVPYHDLDQCKWICITHLLIWLQNEFRGQIIIQGRTRGSSGGHMV